VVRRFVLVHGPYFKQGYILVNAIYDRKISIITSGNPGIFSMLRIQSNLAALPAPVEQPDLEARFAAGNRRAGNGTEAFHRLVANIAAQFFTSLAPGALQGRFTTLDVAAAKAPQTGAYVGIESAFEQQDAVIRIRKDVNGKAPLSHA